MLNFYQDKFYWGNGGRETTEFFEKGLSLFNSNLKKLIKKYVLVDLEKRHYGDWDNVVKKQFLNARVVCFGNSPVIAPVWDLINHEVISLPFIITHDGLSTPYYPPMDREITFSYNNKSSLNRFFKYGFFAKETIVFSFPFSMNIKELGINFVCQGKEIKDDSINIELSDNEIILEGIPIADVNQRTLPSDYFDQILRRINDVKIPKNLLSEIIKYNISSRQEIFHESSMINHEVANMLCEIISYELNLISTYD